MKPPTLEHVSLWIQTGRMETAIDFFRTLGWELWPGRKVEWETGLAMFVYPPSVSVYIQLTEERSQEPGEDGSASHIALVCSDVEETLQAIRSWAIPYDFNVVYEDVGGGKQMVTVSELFHGALELIPRVHPDLITLVTTGGVLINQ